MCEEAKFLLVCLYILLDGYFGREISVRDSIKSQVFWSHLFLQEFEIWIV
jgi:hypothetical protein